ncbi:MAG: ABC transporter permease [Lachnospiraceae bacterium]|nr:ABC transporter permease [Lachnospiraceae bacterium]
MLCIVFGSITVFVIVMVVVLLVRTKLLRERRTYGIHKALGFTNGQLMRSTMMADIPVIAVGAVIGTIAAHLLADSIVALCLSFCGITQGNMYMNPVFEVLTVLGITVAAVLAESICSLKIRKMEPVKLITEE